LTGPSLPLYARLWRDEDRSIQVWRGHLNPETFAGYFSYLHPFLRAIGKGPDELVAWARDPANVNAVLDAINNHVSGIQRRFDTKRLTNASVRSFLMHNRVMLPRDPTLIIRGSSPPVERQLTIPQIRELAGLAVQPWRSMILMKWGSLSDNRGLIDISENHAEILTKALQANADICKLTMPGRKKRRNVEGFYTFAHPEALASLREYFDRERGWPKKGEPVWVYGMTRSRGRPVTTRGFEEAWLRLLKRAKLIPSGRTHDPGTRYGFNVHNTRDLAISELCTVPGFNVMVADFIAGHEIDPLRYKEFYKTKPQYVEEQYRLAAPYLSIVGAPPGSQETEEQKRTITRLEERLAKLEAVHTEELVVEDEGP
jgi:hypothetical protein